MSFVYLAFVTLSPQCTSSARPFYCSYCSNVFHGTQGSPLYIAHERVEPVPSVILTSLISVQLPARTHPATSKGSALRPSGTTPAPATPGSMGQSVNTVRLALGWCCFGS